MAVSLDPWQNIVGVHWNSGPDYATMNFSIRGWTEADVWFEDPGGPPDDNPYWWQATACGANPPPPPDSPPGGASDSWDGQGPRSVSYKATSQPAGQTPTFFKITETGLEAFTYEGIPVVSAAGTILGSDHTLVNFSVEAPTHLDGSEDRTLGGDYIDPDTGYEFTGWHNQTTLKFNKTRNQPISESPTCSLARPPYNIEAIWFAASPPVDTEFFIAQVGFANVRAYWNSQIFAPVGMQVSGPIWNGSNLITHDENVLFPPGHSWFVTLLLKRQ